MLGKRVHPEMLKHSVFYNCIVPEFNQQMVNRKRVERLIKMNFDFPFRCSQLHTLVEVMQKTDGILAGMQLYAALYPDKLKILQFDVPFIKAISLSLYMASTRRYEQKLVWLKGIIEHLLRDKLVPVMGGAD